MAGLSAGAIAGIVSAVASVASTAYTISQSGGSSDSPRLPGPSGGTQDLNTQLKARIPGTKADASARAGGGISPDFLANLVGQESGVPAGGLNVLDDIRRSLGPGINAP